MPDSFPSDVMNDPENAISRRLEASSKNRPEGKRLAEEAVDMAGDLLEVAKERETFRQRMQSSKMGRMMGDPAGKALTLALADQAFRSRSYGRAASQFRHLIASYGIPDYLPFWERWGMRLGAWASQFFPGIVMPLVTWKLRAESSEVILPSEDELLRPHLLARRSEGTRLNINQLGEAILGDEEAGRRLDQNIERLKSPEVEYISVKISAIFSQLHLIAFDWTVDQIKEHLRKLYRTARTHTFRRASGEEVPKFVNLDMEEYRDLHLTTTAFKEVLMEDEFLKMEAGIVLQGYLPDSFEVQRELTLWARARVDEHGGEGIKVRIVKGANLAMEKVEAEIHDWRQAPYESKEEVDANFKRMVQFGCRPENARVVRLGIGSHNLFDICYAMLLREIHGVTGQVEFEMLEGMANHQASAVQEAAKGLLLYAPVVKKEDFHSAIAYLIRRLDENTAPQNFLHDLFGLEVGSAAWENQKTRFLTACEEQDTVSAVPNRAQNRSTEIHKEEAIGSFTNVADTDWSLPANRDWILEIVESWRGEDTQTIPFPLSGGWAQGMDPSRPGRIAYRYSLADAAEVEMALSKAVDAQLSWEAKSLKERAGLLKKAALSIAENRGEAIACMVLDGGKVIAEADAELSEAVDFANYYADSMLEISEASKGCESRALGVVLVTPPWNFPYAIACGGILAALVAGNSVILKPAPEAVLTGWRLVNHLWSAGISRDVLQFLPCPDNELGKALVSDPRVGGVILTGAYETARMFQSWRPEMRLFAETSGKNSLIVTAAADLDQAIKDLVKSAFGHAGQKCSAASLAILESEVYDSEMFRRQLRDAAASLEVGSAWEAQHTVNPVIREPGEELKRGLTSLDEGEEWLLEPRMVDGNQCLWRPGIKLGVKQGSWFQETECFGPVLGLVRADNLDHAIRIQNDSEFGLTGGIHSLDDREIARWRESVEVGNGYINRAITGAIVQRQPFGGWKRSCFGPGAKAGGPNYVANLCVWTQAKLPGISSDSRLEGELAEYVERLAGQLASSAEKLELKASALSYQQAYANHYALEHDPAGLKAESNVFRYVPFAGVVIRLGREASELDLCKLLIASTLAGNRIEVSAVPSREQLMRRFQGLLHGGGISFVCESESEMIARLSALESGWNRVIRCVGSVQLSAALHKAASESGWRLIDGPPLSNGRLELHHHFREQAISETCHRYGNVIRRNSAPA